jgi:hypothetical protein
LEGEDLDAPAHPIIQPLAVIQKQVVEFYKTLKISVCPVVEIENP